MGENKRKQPPNEGSKGSGKKSKRGNEGKWKTPHQRNMIAHRLDLGTTIENGDAGIWVTCQRGLEKKAISEMTLLCDEVGESIYGIKPPSQLAEDALLENQDSRDVAARIEDELASLKEADKQSKAEFTFLPVRSGIECVFFMKTRTPVEPVKFVDRICDEAAACSQISERKLRYVNRLSPMVLIGKSLDSGVEKVAREVLKTSFELRPDSEGISVAETAQGESTLPAHTYAIRPNIRASSLKRDEVINRVAALVGEKHKVSLTNPDKVILIEVFKNFCGLSVVDGPRWEKMRKYNINEIYKLSPSIKDGKFLEAAPGEATGPTVPPRVEA